MSHEDAIPRRRRTVSAVALAALVSVMTVANVALPAFADDATTTTTATTVPPDTTTTTAPPDTTTTTAPPDTTTTTAPPDTTTTTTAPEDTTTTTAVPADAGPPAAAPDLTPGETLAPQPAFASLSDYQRGLLHQLQDAVNSLATRQLNLVELTHWLAVAQGLLKDAEARECAAVVHELLALSGAALGRADATTQSVGVPDTSSVERVTLAATRPRAKVSSVDARMAALKVLTRRLESERKSAERARVKLEASVATLTAAIDAAKGKSFSDAAAARANAETAVKNEFGEEGLQAQPDAITSALATAQAGQTAPILVTGFAMPIPGAPLGSPFGIRIDPIGGGVGFHPGLDFEASSGTPIHAAAAGVVVMAGDCGGYGNCVVIDHGSALATVYGHQSQVLTHVGDHVNAGDVIGLVGSTGLSTGPHLHFEVRVHGIAIDPLPTLTG